MTKTLGAMEEVEIDEVGTGGAPYMPGQKTSAGPVFAFMIPASARRETDPRVAWLRELSPGDMATIRAVAASSKGKLTTEFVATAAALVSVDGRAVNHAESEGEAILGACSAKVRALLQLAFAKIHTTTDEEDEAFLSSMTPVG